jgi:CPA2 family monovalent cation:H+ antiporter-2
MPDTALLRDLLVLVAVAIPVVAIGQRLRVPSVVGFLLAGIAIGPHGLGLIARADSVSGIAEIGVVLLLFAIGLELPFSRVLRMGRPLVQGGTLQVAGTLAVVALLAAALGTPWPRAVFFGALVALSSTAVVLKAYQDRGELDAPHARAAVAVLIFQDLCVVPLMLLVPVLGGAGSAASGAAGRILVSLAALVALLAGGRVALPWLLRKVVATGNRELFTLGIVFFGLGAAFLTSLFGLSLAIGAFIAGVVISESEYGLQALSDVLPFRDVFSGVFFASVGMLFDVGVVRERPLEFAGVVVGLQVVKAVVATLAVLSLRRSFEVSLRAGLGLAQVGEFAFVLAAVGVPLGLFPERGYQLFLGASVYSMLAAPFLIRAAGPVAERLAHLGRRAAPRVLRPAAVEAPALADHVIVVGYGINGRNIARALRAAGIGYVILEQNGEMVRRARARGETILFGDGTRAGMLERAGVERARVLVYAIAVPHDERRGVAVARGLNPRIRIIVRTRYVAAVRELEQAGANEVVPEEFETSLEIFARVLRAYAVPANVIRREVDVARGTRYEMLRGLAMPDLRVEALASLGVAAQVETVEVEEGAEAIGMSAIALRLRTRTGATVLAAVREGKPIYEPDPSWGYRRGDVVVLVGTPEALAKAEPLFVRQA